MDDGEVAWIRARPACRCVTVGDSPAEPMAERLDELGLGGCGKAGQGPLRVSTGAPHIRIAKCLVGGR